MELNLKNPLIFFDLETTGIDVINDKIVEISYLKVYPNGKEVSTTYLVNPERPIPAEASAIHKITDEMVADKPTFKQLAKTIAKDIEGCDIAGYNSNRFDVPLLIEELLAAGVDVNLSNRKFIDVQTIFHKKEQRTLTAAYKFYCGLELEGAHSAEHDVRATYEVLKGQLDKYPDLENDMEFLAAFTTQNRNVDFTGRIVYNEQNVEVFNFGKYKGVPVEEVLDKDPGYYGWMQDSQFARSTKKVLTEIKLRRLNK